MPNAATLLADRLDQWGVPAGNPPARHRGGPNPASQAFWVPFREAVRWLEDVERALDAMDASGDNTGPYRGSLPAWYSAVFSMDMPWHDVKNHARLIADPRDIAILRALGQALDMVKFEPQITGDDADRLRSVLDGARGLIIESRIDESTRRYLLGLVTEALRCLDELAAFGTARLRSLVFELGGAMEAAAETVPMGDAAKATWHKTAHEILIQLIGGGGAGAIGAAVQAALGS